MMEELRKLKISNPDVECLRILLHGPVGGGKSSLVNSIDSIFQGRMSQRALADSTGGTSFTMKLHSHRIKDRKSGGFLPFSICDIMGLENTDVAGAHIDDIKLVLEGHVKEGYKFNRCPLDKNDLYYNSSPTLSDKVHCLVSVIPADKISLMEDDKVDDVINKLRAIRKKATEMRIPQVVIATKVDITCPRVSKDLQKIYESKSIKNKECSNKLGIPMNAIFPVKNYNQVIDLDDNVDILLLSAIKNIVNFADDHVGEKVKK